MWVVSRGVVGRSCVARMAFDNQLGRMLRKAEQRASEKKS